MYKAADRQSVLPSQNHLSLFAFPNPAMLTCLGITHLKFGCVVRLHRYKEIVCTFVVGNPDSTEGGSA